jgi:uncharacterized OB-fold protein
MGERRPDRMLGPAHDQFWAWCAQDELRLQRCTACSRISWPVVQACEYCEGTALVWERMSGRGRIVSWCTFERDYYAGVLPIPWETILVELEEGPLFISNPIDLSWSNIQFNMPVKLSFLDCEDRAGSFRLPVFGRA